MKKYATQHTAAAIMICIVFAVITLAACGSGYDEAAGGFPYEETNSLRMEYDFTDDSLADISPGAVVSAAGIDYSEGDRSYTGQSNAQTSYISATAPAGENLSEKIIYTYYADIETLVFDKTISEIEKLIELHGAFVENSSISGVNYHSQRYGNQFRYAHFTIRIPAEQLNTVVAKLDTLGNVINQNSNATNITAQFTDTQSRLNSLRVQEERLLDMLSKAESIEDLITIENSLSNIRYQIESLTSTLTNWQRQVDYSTLTLSISEVEEYKEIVPINRTYWEQMGDGILRTLRNVGSFFSNLFMWLVVNAPVLLILAVIAVVFILVVRKNIRKSRAKAEEMRQRNIAAANMQVYNQPEDK